MTQLLDLTNLGNSFFSPFEKTILDGSMRNFYRVGSGERSVFSLVVGIEMGDGNWVFELLFSCFCILVIFGCGGGDGLGGVYVEDWEECGLNMILFEGDVVYNSFGSLCVFV